MNANEKLLARLDEAAGKEPIGSARDIERSTRALLDALQPANGTTVLMARASDLCRIDHDRLDAILGELETVTLKCVWMRRSRTGDLVHPRIAQVRRSYSEPWPETVSTVVAFVPHLLEPSVALTLLLEAAELFPNARLHCVAHSVDNAVAELVEQEVQAEFTIKPEVKGRRRFDDGSRRGSAIKKLLWENGDLARDEPSQIPPIVSISMRREIETRNEPPTP